MKFRPCIDIHNGKSEADCGWKPWDTQAIRRKRILYQSRMVLFTPTYIKEKGLTGGHIILLNSVASEYFPATREQAFLALRAYPGGFTAWRWR